MSFRHVIAVAAMLSVGSIRAQTPPPAPVPATTTTTAPAASAAQATPAAPLKPGDTSAGQAKAGVCAACHGMDGNSASAQYPKLAGQHAAYIVQQLEMFKSGKRPNPIMVGFASMLNEQEMRDVGAYFASKTSLPGVADTKLVAQGEALYRGGNKDEQVPACMACHGPDGRGNPGAGYPQLAGQHADYVALMLKDWRDGKSWGDDDHAKIMVLVAKGLTDADIAALASYVEGLHTASASTAAK